ncbi:hypothetical protein DPM19_10080 [Actinomadura craniellae]|uniref:DUF4190 domain-containing protein n=1 Tax=Actinomadura craniellae TaxID=2231787 RepID=A0A365H7J3_9ACTN|nr:DUF4190 domain-containing protein [Actinomadura craniellae]RAY15075.1 hypothetical protein DPM19_10080 [Actinomadura craniellae]
MNEDPGAGPQTAQQQPGPDESARRSGLRALWLGLGSLLGIFLFPPLALLAGIAAIVFGIRARRAGNPPGAIAGLITGAIGLVISAMVVAMLFILGDELSGYQKCLDRSNTRTDREACQKEYFPKFEDRLNLPRGSMDKYGPLMG